MADEKPWRYSLGGGWGDAINVIDWEKRKFVGWKPRSPQVGDYLFCKMESGKVGILRFKEVEYMRDPRDMFFATCEDVGFEGECELPEMEMEHDPLDELRKMAVRFQAGQR